MPGDFQLGITSHVMLDGKNVDAIEPMALATAFDRWRSGDELSVQSCDGMCLKLTTKRVVKMTQRMYDGDVLVFTVNGKPFVCTPEHLMPVSRDGTIEIVEASAVLETDKLMVRV